MRITLLAATLVAFAAPLGAQETRDTFQIDRMVVTATRLPQPIANVSAAVSVIHHSEFERLGMRNAADVLRSVTGAALVQGGSYGALSSLFLRGGESDYVQVLLDGVQINSPGELFDYSALSLENIERIEVVKGPASVLYGSDAVAGVVQLFSKQGATRARGHFTALAGRGAKIGASADGNFDSIDLRGDASGGSAGINYSLGVSHFGTEGALAYNNKHQLTSGTARIAARPGAKTDAAVSARVTRNLFHYPTDGSGNLVDTNQFHEANSVALGFDGGLRFNERTQLRGQLSWSRNEDHIDDTPDSPADTLGFFGFTSDEDFRRRAIDVRINHALGSNTVFTVGGELEKQSREGSSVAASQFGDFENEAENDRENRAVYTQLVTALGRLNLQGGLRLDDNDPFGHFVTYRAGLALPVSRMLRVRASAGTGFKEPRFFEQFSEGFGARGNPNLEPEQSQSTEIGADFGNTSFSIGATAFSQTFKDLIQYTFTPVTADSVNYTNVGEVRSNGIELEGQFVSGALSLRANMTLLDTEVIDAGAGNDPLYAEGERLIRRPTRTASVAANYGTTFNVGMVLNHVGQRDDLYYDETFTPQRVELPAYTRVDLTARSPSLSGARAMIKLENLLNEKYEEIRGFPGRGRIVFVGVTVER